MTNRTNPTTATRPEVAHDERWLELLLVEFYAAEKLGQARRSLCEYAAATKGSGIERRRPTSRKGGATYVVESTGRPATAEEALPWVAKLATGEAEVKDLSYSGWPRSAAGVIERYEERLAAHQEAFTTVALHDAKYTGWTRFMLVTSSSGHVHSSTHCSTCRPTTGYAPMPSLSGLDESSAVAEIGEALCSVCFPTAPVKPSKITQAQALVLLEQGEEAFIAARRKAAAKRR